MTRPSSQAESCSAERRIADRIHPPSLVHLVRALARQSARAFVVEAGHIAPDGATAVASQASDADTIGSAA